MNSSLADDGLDVTPNRESTLSNSSAAGYVGVDEKENVIRWRREGSSDHFNYICTLIYETL